MFKLLLVLVALSPLFVSVNAGQFYTSEEGNSFYVDTEPLFTWYDAIHVCASKNMRLITPDTEKKYLEIYNLRLSLHFDVDVVWTSGHEIEDLKFAWTTTGNNITYTKWSSGEPSREGTTSSQCILFVRASWGSYNCLSKRRIMCEEDPMVKEKTQELNVLKIKQSAELNQMKSDCENEAASKLEELQQSCRNETQKLTKANVEELDALKNEMNSYCKIEMNSKDEELRLSKANLEEINLVLNETNKKLVECEMQRTSDLNELKKSHENDRNNALDDKHREISVLKLDCEKQLNQLTLANKIQENEMLKTFHAKELRLLEEKQNRTGVNKSYSFLFNVHGNRN